MWPTHEDAVEMYAKFCRAHYGFNAHEKVKKRAKELAALAIWPVKKFGARLRPKLRKA